MITKINERISYGGGGTIISRKLASKDKPSWLSLEGFLSYHAGETSHCSKLGAV